MTSGPVSPGAEPDDPDDLTAEDFEAFFAWMPFDWRWLLAGWTLGFAVGVVAVLWFLVYVAGPTV